MKRSDEIKQEIASLVDEMDAMVAKAKDELGNDRQLTAAEQSRWHAVMAKETGQLAKLQTELESAVQEEDQRARLRASRTLVNTVTPVYDIIGTRGGPIGGPTVKLPSLTAFKGNGNREQAARDAYDTGLAIKAVLFRDSQAAQKLSARRGEAYVASLNESNPVDGGYLVPPELGTAVFTAWEQTGAIQQLARRVPMKSDSLEFVKQTAGTTVYYPGEEGEITASDLDVGRVALVPKKRAILSYISNELKDDAIIPVVDMLAADMGHQFALKQDQEGILGDGTSTYGGVAGIKTKLATASAGISQAATGHDTWPEIDLADIAAWFAKLPDKFRVQGELKILCSQAFKWSVFDRLALNAGGALAMTFVDGVPQYSFLGIPIVSSDRCETATTAATVCAYFGNWGQGLLLGERTQIRIATSEHVAFTSDRLAVRATARYDINVHEPGSTGTAGAIVALKTAA